MEEDLKYVSNWLEHDLPTEYSKMNLSSSRPKDPLPFKFYTKAKRMFRWVDSWTEFDVFAGKRLHLQFMTLSLNYPSFDSELMVDLDVRPVLSLAYKLHEDKDRSKLGCLPNSNVLPFRKKKPRFRKFNMICLKLHKQLMTESFFEVSFYFITEFKDLQNVVTLSRKKDSVAF